MASNSKSRETNGLVVEKKNNFRTVNFFHHGTIPCGKFDVFREMTKTLMENCLGNDSLCKG